MKRVGIVAVVLSIMVTVIGTALAPASAARADVRSPVIGDFHTSSHDAPLSPLRSLTSPTLEQFLDAHEGDVGTVLRHPPSAHAIAHDWKQLGSQKRAELLRAAPAILGNLHGIPLSVRDKVNTKRLRAEISEVSHRLSSPRSHPASDRAALTQKAAGLERIRSALQSAPSQPRRSLAVLDTRGAWRTVIVVGDLDTARYVSYLVPGMFFSVQNQVDDWVTTAQELYDAQRRWLSRLGERGGVATVAWIGYKTPGLGAVGSVSLAESGADYLEASLLGLRTARRGDEPFVSVLAHSYGSTAALLALQRHTVSVNSLALLGSPGSDAHSVSALDVTGGAVYAARAKFDPVGESGYFGSTPTSDSYGATVLSVAGGTDPLTGRSLDPSYGHNEYFTPGSESMRNLALIAIGRGGLVLTTAHPGSRLDSVRARALLLLR